MAKEAICRICGTKDCRKHTLLISNKKIDSFSGSSPPEIFIGKWNYPNVYAGILSPQESGNTEALSSQEIWHEKRLPIPEILKLRDKLIYGRTQTNIKKLFDENFASNFIKTIQEVAMAKKSISAEFKLKKPIEANKEKDSYIPVIGKAALIEKVSLQENPIIEKKVDYIVSDTDVKSKDALLELEKSKIQTSMMIKILSAGLLGLKKNRKLVPTRWSITAVDDLLSKEKLKEIKTNPEISEIQVFTAEYIGNHYEFLLLPDKFSFEVIEISTCNNGIWTDYETFFGRKNYAESVTGAYYANRLALTEYLEKIKKQASCLVIRQISEEYTQSMGVGVLRQISREAFSKQPEIFSSLNEALSAIQKRLTLPIEIYTNKSILIKNYGKQKKISEWFK
jgi:hypothetical protein